MKRNILFTYPIPRFKRWSRKPYGIFASLNRRVEIGVLSVGMSILLSPTAAKGQTVDTLDISRRIMLETVNVSGSKSAPPRSVTTVERLYSSRNSEVCAATATVESVLSNTPSVDVRSRGGEGVQADISIRGGSADQTMVRLNGIDFTDARTGHQSHSLPIDMDNVDRIELLDALASVGAYSGAIDMVVSPATHNTLRGMLVGGAHRFGYGNLSGTLVSKNASFFGATSFKRSDGHRPNTEFDNLNIYGRTIITPSGGGVVDIQAGYQNRSFGANGFYSLKYPNQAEQTATLLTSVRYLRQLSSHWSMTATGSYRRNTDRFELVRGEPETVPYNYHLTDNFGAELWFDHSGRFGKSSLGGDYRLNSLLSTVLGTALTTPEKISGIEYTKSAMRHTANLWARHTLPVGKRLLLSLCGGTALTSYGTALMWSSSAGWHSDGLNLELGAVRSMRLPTFNALYYTAKGYVGDPNLDPEKAITLRLGGDYTIGGFTAASTIYYRWGENVIDWVKSSADDDWHSTQTTRLDTFGAEMKLVYRFTQLPFEMAALSYGFVSTDKQSSGTISKYSLDYMRNKLSAAVATRLLAGFRLNVEATLFDRNGNYLTSSGDVAEYKPYVLVDANLGWCKGIVDLTVGATNLTATEYFDFGGLPMPRRELKLGLTITM